MIDVFFVASWLFRFLLMKYIGWVYCSGLVLRWVEWAIFKLLEHIQFSCVLLHTVLLLLVTVAESSWKNSPNRKFLQNQNISFIKFEFVISWCFRAKTQALFQNQFSDRESSFFDMLNMIVSSKFLVVRGGFFVKGRSPWMLLSIEFLIVCTVGVELFISGENLFVILIWKLFSNRFLRCAEWRGINHLCWSSDEIDPVVVVSLYFTLHLYFRNAVNFRTLKISTWGD